MASSPLLDALRAQVTPELLARASAHLNESEIGVAKGLGAAFPTLLAALVRKADDVVAIERLLALFHDPVAESASGADPTRMLEPGGDASPAAAVGQRFATAVLGGRATGVAQALSSFAGVRAPSTQALLGIAATLVVGLLRGVVRGGDLDAAGLSGYLLARKDAILAELPATLRDALGLEPMHLAPFESAARGSPGVGWFWAALGLLLAFGVWSVARAPRPLHTATASPPVAAPPPPGASSVRALPNGTEIELSDSGFEARLIASIESEAPAAESAWFEFDRLLFESGSAVLRPDSRTQLATVAAILRAYPTVSVRIGGYTDDAGDPEADRVLSQKRAERVAGALVELGVERERLDAIGYGNAHLAADNATEEGRAGNRRIALRVMDK